MEELGEKINYYQKKKKCRKKNCSTCRDGDGHGPYWFATWTQNGRTVEKYVGVRLPEAKVQVGRTNQSPLVGRARELTVLRERIEALSVQVQGKMRQKRRASSLQDPPHFILLTGEAGLGKTRLAEEAGRYAASYGWKIVWGHAYAQEKSIPYRIWIDILRAVRALDPSAQPSSSRLGTLLPELTDLSVRPALSLEQDQLRIWEGSCELLMKAAQQHPLLLVLDDLQWADSSSYTLLAYIARRLWKQPIIVLGTFRDDEVGTADPLRTLLTDLQREACVDLLPLSPLAPDHISALVSSISVLSPSIRQRITNHTAGNPYFIEELVRTLFLASLDEKTPNPSVLDIPPSISGLLDQRLTRLSPECQQLLGKAAVLGDAFDFAALCALEKATSGGRLDEGGQQLDALEEATHAGILVEEGDGTHITYRFWHPLLAEHLYFNRLSAVRRALYHRKVATLLQERAGERVEPEAASITNHLLKGGASAQTIADYAEIAANHAYVLSAYPEAEHHYFTALTQVHSLASEEVGTGRISARDEREARLKEAMGECTRIQGKFDEARTWYEEALAIRKREQVFDTLQDRHRALQFVALLQCEAGFSCYSRGEWERASLCYRRSEEILRDGEILGGPAWAHLRYRQSYVSWRRGMYEEALQSAREALALTEQALATCKPATSTAASTLIHRTLAGDPVSLGRIHQILGLISNGAGRYQETIYHWNMALAIFEQDASERDIAILACNLGDVHLRKSDHAPAQSALERALALAQRIGEMPLVGATLGNLGVLAIRQGALAEAESRLREGVLCAERAGDPVHVSILNAYLATALRERGKLSESSICVVRALSVARSMRIAPCVGMALVEAGALRLIQAVSVGMGEEPDRRGQCRMLMRASRSLNRALTLDGIEAETRTEGQLLLSRVLLLQGAVEKAHHLAVVSLEEASRFDLTWLTAQAQRIVGSISLVQGESEEAIHTFLLALHTFEGTGMRLEFGRTLRTYGEALLQRGEGEDAQVGRHALREAQRLFEECDARLDMQLVECTTPIANEFDDVPPSPLTLA